MEEEWRYQGSGNGRRRWIEVGTAREELLDPKSSFSDFSCISVRCAICLAK